VDLELPVCHVVAVHFVLSESFFDEPEPLASRAPVLRAAAHVANCSDLPNLRLSFDALQDALSDLSFVHGTPGELLRLLPSSACSSFDFFEIAIAIHMHDVIPEGDVCAVVT